MSREKPKTASEVSARDYWRAKKREERARKKHEGDREEESSSSSFLFG